MNAAATEVEQKQSLNDQLRDKYKLRVEPFTDANPLFYQGAQRQHNLETLRHLVSYGDMVLMLTGGAGSGKTTLIKELCRHLADGIRVVNLKPSLIASPRKLATEICKRLELHAVEGEPVSRSIERVIEACTHNAALGERLLLVLDDAHKTNKDSFKLLMKTFRGISSDAGICLLVSGRQELLQSVIQEGVDPATCSWIHQIQLKPFSQEDAETYVSLRLIRAGSKAEPELSEAQKKALSDLGKGCPGRINRIAPGVLLDSFDVAGQRQKTSKGLSGLLVGIVVSLIVSFVLIGHQYGLFFSSKEGVDSSMVDRRGERSDKLADSLLSDSTKLAIVEEKINQGANIIEGDLELTSSEIADLPVQDKAIIQEAIEQNSTLNAGLGGSVVEVPAYSPEGVILPSADSSNSNKAGEGGEAQVISSEDHKDRLAETPSAPSDMQEPSAEISEKTEVTTDSSKSVNKAVGSETSNKAGNTAEEISVHPRFRNNKWVASQKKGAYTIQVLGSRNEQTAIKYIDSEKAFQELFYIESSYKNKPWYVVILGVYPDKVAARAKMAKLPASVKKQKPWIRSLKGL